MIVTEEQAKSRWCPFSRTLISMQEEKSGRPLVAAAINRYAPPGEPQDYVGNCIGSQCMLWAWSPASKTNALTAHGADRLEQGLPPDAASIEPNAERAGFCGMSRAP